MIAYRANGSDEDVQRLRDIQQVSRGEFVVRVHICLVGSSDAGRIEENQPGSTLSDKAPVTLVSTHSTAMLYEVVSVRNAEAI